MSTTDLHHVRTTLIAAAAAIALAVAIPLAWQAVSPPRPAPQPATIVVGVEGTPAIPVP
jgi:hypothetical protein